MNQPKLRARPWGTALAFFLVGVLFASAMDWTPFTHAQASQTSRKPSAAAVKSLGETSDAFVAIAEHATPAVVTIQTQATRRNRPLTDPRGRQIDPRQLPPQFRQFYEDQQPQLQEGTGSGFVIRPDGYIVTNNHVVADADRITVVMNNHKVYDAKLIGHDPQTDVAVVKIDAKNLPTVDIGDDDKLRIGEWVLAIGNPLGLDFTVTAGIVSAKGRGNQEVQVNNNAAGITDFIQTDAAINPGNSGGPLMNIHGEVVGINTAIASGTGYYAGYGFAIPIGLAKIVWDDLIEHGHIVRAQLGVSVGPVSAEDAEAAKLDEITGVKVDGCNPDEATSPACRAGVKTGDIILTLDGKSVDRVSALQRIVRAKKPGESVDVKLSRFGKQMEYKVRLNEMRDSVTLASDDRVAPPKAEKNAGTPIGIEVQPISDEDAKAAKLSAAYRGLQITDVEPTGPARGKGFSQDDIIVGVAPSGAQIHTPADLQQALRGKRPGDIISLLIYNTSLRQERVVNVRVQNN
ncbi:MAG TPA: Do family serine endopeptidase [Gemmatimonadaceae bacterium]|nr:Do family serine endopeptidase [Gemmatimonadaceae bacterium]